MLHVFFGTDTEGVREAAKSFITLRQQAGCVVSRFDTKLYEVGQLGNAAEAMSLFGEQLLFVVDSPRELAELHQELLTHVADLATSQNEFVVIEEKLPVGDQRAYSAGGAQVTELRSAAAEKTNPFAITDALAARNKKTLWLLLMAARSRGVRDEETMGLLWWQLKNMRLASCTTTAAEAGLSEFPYKKAKQALHNFKAGELETFTQSFLDLYHRAHKGETTLDVALEAWVLQV